MATEDQKSSFSSVRITAEGNIGQDPRDFSRDKDGSFVSFSLACSYRNYGEEDSEVNWFDVKVRGPVAKNLINSNIGRGDRVIVEGRLYGHDYESGGEVVHSYDIHADSVALSLRFRGAQAVDVSDDDGDEAPRSSRRSSSSSSRSTSRRRSEPADDEQEQEESRPATRRRRSGSSSDDEAPPSGRRGRRSRVQDDGEQLDD